MSLESTLEVSRELESLGLSPSQAAAAAKDLLWHPETKAPPAEDRIAEDMVVTRDPEFPNPGLPGRRLA